MIFDGNNGYIQYYFIFYIIIAVAVFRFFTEPAHEMRWEFNGAVTRVKYYKSTPEVTINNKRYALSLVLWDNDDMVIHLGDILVKHKGSKIFMCIRRNTRDTVYGRIHRFNIKDRERNRREYYIRNAMN